MADVSIVKTGKNIKEDIHKALSYLGGIHSVVQKEDRVLLKPNLNDFDCITHPRLIEGLITYLLDHSIKDIIVVESTFGNKNITEKHFRHSGYYEICDAFNIPLINANSSEYITMTVPNPMILDRIMVAKEVKEATKIINIPVMKVHYATGVTLGLKNLKGFLSPWEKKNFHKTGLDKAIVDLNNTIPVDLTIIDGIQCMETMGPKGGDVFPLGLLIAGTGRGETDYIACKIMGYDLEEVRHLSYYIQNNKVDIDNIKVFGEKPEDVTRPFKKIQLDAIIPENVVIHQARACSACMNALLLSFRIVKQKIEEKIEIYLGSDAQIRENATGDGIPVSFGNCASLPGAKAHIKGCPPYPLLLSSLINEIHPPAPPGSDSL